MAYKWFRKWNRHCTRGDAAMQFAMIAPVFFLLLFAILETGIVFFADMTLENGMKQTARLIRTGQAQAQNLTQAQFRTQLCNQISFLLSCATNKLYIDVRAFSSFGTSAYPQALDVNGNLNANLNSYQTGSSSQFGNANTIVLARAFYTWQMFTPLFGAYFSNMPNNTRLLSASVAFKNEPF